MIVIAHRGHSAGHPENSEAAFEAAIAAGADMIETDLRLTRDGAVVCCHDPDLSRVAGHAGPIADLDAAEIGALRRADGSPAALKLERVLDLAKGRVRVRSTSRKVLPRCSIQSCRCGRSMARARRRI